MSTFVADAIFQALCKDLDDAHSAVSVFGAKPNVEQRQVAIELMRDKFLSKLEPARPTDEQKNAALQAFDESNRLAREWRPDVSSLGTSGEEELVGTFLKFFNDFWEADLGPDTSLDWGNISLHARCGPGASFGARGTSFFQKMYSSTLTASTPYITDLYRADIALWPEESIAEQIRQETFGQVATLGRSKFEFVPKNVKTARLIAVEPTLNTFYQLGVGEILSKRLKRFFGIDLASQPDVNRVLARYGSVIDATHGDGYSTIDLTSASDSLSLGLAGYCIPAQPLDVLVTLRCAYAQVGNDPTTMRELHMLSTMGNGFTFPLQTALFAAATAAAVALDDSIQSMPKAWSESNIGGLYSVFGDDIVVHSRAAGRLLRLLRFLGFRPNPEKCFTSGSFRESCGFDFYQGFNVRPFFLKRVRSEQDLLVCYNGLADWAARVLVPIPNVLKYLSTRLRDAWWVPMQSGWDTGIRVPYSIARTLKRDPSVQSVAYNAFIAAPAVVRFEDGGKPRKNAIARGFHANPSGLYLSILRGECRSGKISVRGNDMVAYRVRRQVCPNWDWTGYTLQEWFDDYSDIGASYPRRIAWVVEGNLPPLRRVRGQKRSGRRGQRK